jgi:hypothetical protein
MQSCYAQGQGARKPEAIGVLKIVLASEQILAVGSKVGGPD